MKRIALKLLLFLLAGAIVNVGVAWGCAVWVDVANARIVNYEEQKETGPWEHRFAIRSERPGATQVGVFWCHYRRLHPPRNQMDFMAIRTQMRLATRVLAASKTIWPDLPRGVDSVDQRERDWAEHSGFAAFHRAVDFRGWPVPSMYSVHEVALNPFQWKVVAETSLIEMGRWQATRPLYLSDLKVIPRAMIPRGLAINTIFYAALVWALFAVSGAVRRRVRIKRGQCASCGYSLRGTTHIEKCPECGCGTSDNVSMNRGASHGTV